MLSIISSPTFVFLVSLFFAYRSMKRLGNTNFILIGLLAMIFFPFNFGALGSSFVLIRSMGNNLLLNYSDQVYAAKVIECEWQNKETNSLCRPTVSFETKAGKIVTKELSFYSSRAKIGKEYQVYYDSETGKFFDSESSGGIWGSLFSFVFFGFFFLEQIRFSTGRELLLAKLFDVLHIFSE